MKQRNERQRMAERAKATTEKEGKQEKIMPQTPLNFK